MNLIFCSTQKIPKLQAFCETWASSSWTFKLWSTFFGLFLLDYVQLLYGISYYGNLVCSSLQLNMILKSYQSRTTERMHLKKNAILSILFHWAIT